MTSLSNGLGNRVRCGAQHAFQNMGINSTCVYMSNLRGVYIVVEYTSYLSAKLVHPGHRKQHGGTH